MNIESFIKKTDFINQKELARVALIAFYYYNFKNKNSFTIEDVVIWFDLHNFNKPNLSRLRANLIKSRDFVISGNSSFSLHAKEMQRLSASFALIINSNENIESTDQILPESLFLHTRGYIEQLSKQINASYEYNIFDGCAVLMRRLLEILLIHTYEKLNIQQDIQNSNGEFKMLNDIIVNSKKNVKIGLSRNTKEHIDDFRKLGNFSAHKIFYSCKKNDIRKVSLEYRACVEELLYKSGLKN